MPQYCVDCKKIGHDHDSCRRNTKASSSKKARVAAFNSSIKATSLMNPPPSTVVLSPLLQVSAPTGEQPVAEDVSPNSQTHVITLLPARTLEGLTSGLKATEKIGIPIDAPDSPLISEKGVDAPEDFLVAQAVIEPPQKGIFCHIDVTIKDDGRLKPKCGSRQARTKSTMKLKESRRHDGQAKEIDEKDDKIRNYDLVKKKKSIKKNDVDIQGYQAQGQLVVQLKN
ncbi:OLC1v1035345C1 [Oldenlandia corymbosa var. corymbosa]|uniref:OLC1v1035345C1 n=1 Tax=Oldenlandia corymbosa var. corymbosa TaxID=529605 RepID=A0AAV1CTH2_OLDCO|nr:OLC1v1035345C1 [Oldenlandia corymbosa var. corymbosa]